VSKSMYLAKAQHSTCIHMPSAQM